MTITAVGSVTVGGSVPGVEAPLLAAEADINARLDAMASFTATVNPPSYSGDLALAAGISASISAAITAGLTPPSISAQLAIVAAAMAVLEAQLLPISNLFTLFAEAGVSIYAFDGAQNVFGSELATALGGSTVHANAVVFITQLGATWTAMQGVFKTTP